MWSLEFYRQYRSHLTLASILALRRAALTEPEGLAGKVLELRLRKPPVACKLRPATSDLWTFDDVFCRDMYGATQGKLLRTIIDLGANIGIASLYLLRDNPDARVFALEPDPGNFVLLTNNLRNCGARIEQGALWNDDGPVTFRPATPTTGQVDSAGSVTVAGYTMASIMKMANFSSVDLLKIDVEGAERYLFTGDRTWLSTVRRCLIEWHDDAREASNFDRIMKAAGFNVRDVGPQISYATTTD